ncbi:cobalt-precorrin-6A reductase [Streptomyces sp. N2-109]|uniref:Cobalt-precorrin-6A reductase n=1 Tax=Streptomyces gossypii TaxID=2883101 RepID=A0ABT2K4T5_9ACTN|nr:cobalt-precorrin-6A reductase [Streptomyces gossypii]MCT2594649.1 cobalt-precorrin-6A reductase [Streptomyces gossypii]
MRHLLVLGGTTEGRRLAALLAEEPGVRVTSSVAGRVARPGPVTGTVRSGGFGGPEGLARWLTAHRVTAVIDATHPFAAAITRNAAQACAATGTPLLVIRRPGWTAGPGDRWLTAASLPEAAGLLHGLGRRVLLTTGRQGVAAFAGLDQLWFLIRSVDPPEPPLPPHARLLADRGPYHLDGERALLREHSIDIVVTKDSGGTATAAKLTAAREAGLPVVIVVRPPLPEGVAAVPGVASAGERLRELGLLGARRLHGGHGGHGAADTCP